MGFSTRIRTGHVAYPDSLSWTGKRRRSGTARLSFRPVGLRAHVRARRTPRHGAHRIRQLPGDEQPDCQPYAPGQPELEPQVRRQLHRRPPDMGQPSLPCQLRRRPLVLGLWRLHSDLLSARRPVDRPLHGSLHKRARPRMADRESSLLRQDYSRAHVQRHPRPVGQGEQRLLSGRLAQPHHQLQPSLYRRIDRSCSRRRHDRLGRSSGQVETCIIFRPRKLRLRLALHDPGHRAPRRIKPLRIQQPLGHFPLCVCRLERNEREVHGKLARLAQQPQGPRIVG